MGRGFCPARSASARRQTFQKIQYCGDSGSALHPEQEKHLAEIADHSGTDTEQLVRNAALRIVAEDINLRAAVRRGIEQADRGETLSHEEVKARIDRLLSH